MPVYAALDSNALTYLVNAIFVGGYNPADDTSGLADERVAMARLFMYGDCGLWVPLIVRAETESIPPGRFRDVQNRTTWYQLLDNDSHVSKSAIEKRVNELLQYHTGFNDCRVAAETEAMDLDYLITRDDKFRRQLQPHTKLRIVRPTELWDSLGIDCAPERAIVPARDNPLSACDWWRLPDR